MVLVRPLRLAAKGIGNNTFFSIFQQNWSGVSEQKITDLKRNSLTDSIAYTATLEQEM